LLFYAFFLRREDRDGGFIVDIAALSMALSQSSIRMDANISLMKKTMEHAELNGQGMIQVMQESSVKAMELSVQPHLGNSIDIRL
jgi:hypothetical protein